MSKKTRKPYCRPLNAGLASSNEAICKRLRELLEAIDNLNAWVIEGQLEDDLRDFRLQICDRLAAEGWTWSYDGGNTLKVRQPGHNRPWFKVLPDGTHEYTK